MGGVLSCLKALIDYSAVDDPDSSFPRLSDCCFLSSCFRSSVAETPASSPIMFVSKVVFLCCVLVSSLPLSLFVSAASSNYPIDRELGPKLSKGASIVHPTVAVQRWSDYDALDPGSVVNVATPRDVLLTVRISPLH